MSRGLLIALGGGLLGAVLFLSVRTANPLAVMVAYAAPLPLFAVGLSQGLNAALIACGIAAVGILVGTGGGATAIYLLLAVVPVIIIVRQALLSRPGTTAGAVEWYPHGLLLGWLAGYDIAVLAGGLAWLGGSGDGVEAALRNHLGPAIERMSARGGDPQMMQAVDAVLRYLPGTVVASGLMMVLGNAALAQTMLARHGHAVRPSPRFAEIELPPLMAYGLIACSVAAMLPGAAGTFGRNAIIVLAIPYMLQGLAVVHILSAHAAGRVAGGSALPGNGVTFARGIFLGLVYVSIPRYGWPALLLTILGIIEQWLHLRRRFAPPAKSPEDE